MTIANEERGEVTISLEGVDYGMRPSFEAIERIERTLGRSLTDLARAANAGGLTLRETAEIVTACIAAYGKSEDQPQLAAFKPERVAGLLFVEGVSKAFPRVAILLFAALTGGVDASGKLKPVTEMKAAAAG